MLEYEWGGNPSTIILSPAGDEPITHQTDEDDNNNNNIYQTDLNRHYFLNINNPFNEHESSHSHSHSHLVNNNIPQPTAHHHPSLFPVHQPAAPQHINPYFDPRAYTLQDHQNQQNYFLIPKTEEVFTSRIGLNLGGRTYFSSADQEDLVSRLYRRSRPPALLYPPISSASRCQAEGCNADLTRAKHYHRRHKVCEFHSKASTVIAHGLTQRFCQQCSRFHLLSEFDNGKRSCRKRLADHNRRRRKSNQANQDISRNKSPQTESARNSPSHTVTRTLPDSGVHSSSSVTVALSPPRISFDYFNQRPYQAAVPATMTTASNFSASSSSLFYSGQDRQSHLSSLTEITTFSQ